MFFKLLRNCSEVGFKCWLKGGERGRNRTFNLLIKSQLLCQLSYAPSSRMARISSWESWLIFGNPRFRSQLARMRSVRRASLHTNLRRRKPATRSILPCDIESLRLAATLNHPDSVRKTQRFLLRSSESRASWLAFQMDVLPSYCTTSVIGVVWEKVPDVAETVIV
jgi:hypothetical protein